MGLQCLETGLLQLNSESILLYGAAGVKSACSYQIQSICCDKPRLFHFRAQLQNCTNFNHCKSHMNQNESKWIMNQRSAICCLTMTFFGFIHDFFHPWFSQDPFSTKIWPKNVQGQGVATEHTPRVSLVHQIVSWNEFPISEELSWNWLYSQVW